MKPAPSYVAARDAYNARLANTPSNTLPLMPTPAPIPLTPAKRLRSTILRLYMPRFVAVLLTTYYAAFAGPSEFVIIPGGRFLMGDFHPADTQEVRSKLNWTIDEPEAPRFVMVSTFEIGRYEVTTKLWNSVIEWANSHGYSDLEKNDYGLYDDTTPVNGVSWHDAVKWCNARSEMDNLEPCYYAGGYIYKSGIDDAVVCQPRTGYRLPTEAEWEKAARGGVPGERYPWGDIITQDHAHYRYTSIVSTFTGHEWYDTCEQAGIIDYSVVPPIVDRTRCWEDLLWKPMFSFDYPAAACFLYYIRHL